LRRLQDAIGSSRRPSLLTAIRDRLVKALTALSGEMADDLRREMDQILKQIGDDIEILRGTEAQMLAKNGDFLERLNGVMTEMETQLALITDMTVDVKAEAEKNGYL
jgi:hypothetical protein